MEKYKLNGQIGMAGELRVMSELLLRGFNPAKAYLDKGVDVVLDNGKKMQIKTATKHKNKVHGQESYHFFLIPGDSRRRDLTRDRTKEVDVFVFWCIDNNTFYIIPSKDLQGKKGLFLMPEAKQRGSKYNIWKERWDLLA